MKSNIKRKPLTLALALVLAIVTIVGATFAWFTANESVDNRLATKDALANVHLQETFVEPDDWKPGQTITKEVAVADVGSAPALVRISFEELLKVNYRSDTTSLFNKAAEDADKTPVLFDDTAYPHALPTDDWFEVTTTANATKGGIKLAASYAPVKVYAKYVAASAAPGGSIGSYSFAVWAPITDSTCSFEDELQAVTYTREWDGDTKTLTLSNIKYLCYQSIEQAADWTAATPPTAGNIGKSVAETAINAMTAVAGKYPNNIQLNYDNVITTLAGDSTDNNKWYYNASDGYFYFIGLVQPGTITPNMLKSLLLNTAADSDYYGNMVFDLIVNMDALQHTKDAVAADWTTVAANTALKTALEGFCES